MRTILLLLIFFICINISAQIGFENHTIISELEATSGTKSVFSADIDGDGDKDILFAANCTDDWKLGWYENLDGLGEFSTPHIISLSLDYVNSVYAADFDGDGDMDVVSSNPGAYATKTKIVWYENLDGLGNFSDEKIISTKRASLVIADDLDKDGDIDIISGSNTEDKITWYKNIDGQGGFGTEQVINSDVDNLVSIYTSDLDGDGDMDILSASNNDDKIAWYENLDGQGSFGTQQIISVSGNGPTSVFSADLDGDNDMDVIVSSIIDKKIVWYENIDGYGNFSSEKTISINISSVNSVFATDIDGDNNIDILSSSVGPGLNNIAWYKNIDGLGSFSVQQNIVTNRNSAILIYATDIDGDSDMDVISADSEKIMWNRNTNGLGGFGNVKYLTKAPKDVRSLFSIDIDGDGDKDILLASFQDDTIIWYENMDGKGNFGYEKIITNKADGATAVYSCDIDNDGDLDVISGSSNDDKVSWYENVNGLGSFSDEKIISTQAFSLRAIYSSDIDGDGDMDILSASSSPPSSGKVVWYENIDGQGNFSSEKTISESRFLRIPNSISTADIDGDNDLDVVASFEIDHSVIWFENTNSLGVFGEQHNVSTNFNNPSSVYTTDIEKDGDIDILFGTGDGKVVLFENLDGFGSFSNEKIISSNALVVKTIKTQDLDKDGDLDILYSCRIPSGGIVWHENIDGQGNFGVQQIIYKGTSSSSNDFSTDDIDLDGDIDIITTQVISCLGTEHDAKILSWHENLGAVINEINGNVHLDINTDGCDNSDLSMPNLMIISDGGVGSIATFTRINGFYQLFLLDGNYTTSISAILPNYFTVNPNLHTNNFSGLKGNYIADFCIEPNQTINDVNITILPISQTRPGFNSIYQLVFHNVGTTQLSGSVTLTFDNTKLSFLTASESILSQTQNTLTFNYNNLNPFESRTIDLTFNVFAPPTTNIGDILNFTATINPISGDNTEYDNTFTYNETVIGSYDPNDIAVLEGNQILLEDADDYLHYIIRFQNTGTADAINVKVDNVLDPKLDWTSLQLQSSSHTNRVEIKNGSEVSFIFNGIYLPDSTSDEPNSHGFIAYKIKPKSNVVVGDILSNKADIFFDFNPAIETNMVTTEITGSLNLNENSVSKFYLYPNPTSGIININSATNITKLEVYNNLGQVVLLELNKAYVDTSVLSAGIYFIKVKDDLGNLEIKKVIKK